MEQIRSQNTHTPVIVMSAFGIIANAVEAMKKGPADFIIETRGIPTVDTSSFI